MRRAHMLTAATVAVATTLSMCPAVTAQEAPAPTAVEHDFLPIWDQVTVNTPALMYLDGELYAFAGGEYKKADKDALAFINANDPRFYKGAGGTQHGPVSHLNPPADSAAPAKEQDTGSSEEQKLAAWIAPVVTALALLGGAVGIFKAMFPTGHVILYKMPDGTFQFRSK